MTSEAQREERELPAVRLSNHSVALMRDDVRRYRYDRRSMGIGIVHLGPGAFHRGHQAFYTDRMMNRVGGDWGICEVSLRSSDTRDRLAPQDNLYTLCELGRRTDVRIIGAIQEILVAREDINRVIERLALPSVKVVTLTITEKGYCLTPGGHLDRQHPMIAADLEMPAAPQSAIGVIVAGLKARRDRGVDPVVILSCDNLTDNGVQLRSAVVDYASELSADLSEWIEANVPFPSTMVDSITPATTGKTIRAVAEATGLEDTAPVQREPFTQWIIEEVPGVNLPPWHTAGAHLVSDVRPFEVAKHRILNGLHTSAAFLGLYAGLETVEEAVKHRHIRAFLERLCIDEIFPTVPHCPGLDLSSYAADVFRRFDNPGLRHELQQIAWDTSKKLPYRIIDSLFDNLSSSRPVVGLCTILAAWIAVLQQRIRDGEDIIDPLSGSLIAVLERRQRSSANTVAEVFEVCGLQRDSRFVGSIMQDVSDRLDQLKSAHPEAVLESLV